jgi:hypothetical protein
LFDSGKQWIGKMHAQDAEEEIMTGSILLIIGWILIVASTAMLLTYKLRLRRYDQRLLRLVYGSSTPLHAALQNRMTHIDRWGVSLTMFIAICAVLFPVYLLFQAFAKIAQALLRLLSFI